MVGVASVIASRSTWSDRSDRVGSYGLRRSIDDLLRLKGNFIRRGSRWWHDQAWIEWCLSVLGRGIIDLRLDLIKRSFR